VGFGIGLGPRVFRVRVSTRGVGMSSGIGPFSVYGHNGSGRRRSSGRRTARSTAPGNSGPVFQPGDTTTTNLIGASAHQLTPSGSDELVGQLNRAQKWLAGWLWVGVICLLLSGATPLLLIPTVAAFLFAFVGFSRRRVLLQYDEVDSDLTTWFDRLASGWPTLSATKGKWRVQSSTRLHQTHHRKVNGGAGHLVSRHRVAFQTKTPLALKTNLKVPTIKAKRHNLMFLPDRLLVKSGNRWSDVDYNHLDVKVTQGRFIEDSMGAAPRDGTKVAETWQYANVKGGPDRRFKNNRRLPVMLYSEVALTSPSGLGWELRLSRHDVATWWQQALRTRPSTSLLTAPAPTAIAPGGVVTHDAEARPQKSESGGGKQTSLGQRYIDSVTPARPATDGEVVVSPGDKASFDYRSPASAVVDALVAIHANGGAKPPAIDSRSQRITIAPEWVKEYVGLVSICADLQQVTVGTDAVTRVHWSTQSSATPTTMEQAAEGGHRAAERANNILAHLLV